MANTQPIQRDDRLVVRMSKEEKEIFNAYAQKLGINSSRLARNIILEQAESLLNDPFYIPITKAYIRYLKLTNQKEAVERLQED